MQIARRPSPVRGSFPSARKALAAMAMALAATRRRPPIRTTGGSTWPTTTPTTSRMCWRRGRSQCPLPEWPAGADARGGGRRLERVRRDRRRPPHGRERRESGGRDPLMYLAIAGQTDRARALIARGAQVNRLGWTPLHYAASKGQLAMAQLLLQQGHGQRARAIGRNAADDGRAVGQQAHGRAAAQAGADVTTRDTKGQNAADWATTGKSTAGRRAARADRAPGSG